MRHAGCLPIACSVPVVKFEASQLAFAPECCREGLIAVNYPARAKGITRHMRAPEAKARCPELRLVHVQTIGNSEEALAADGEVRT